MIKLCFENYFTQFHNHCGLVAVIWCAWLWWLCLFDPDASINGIDVEVIDEETEPIPLDDAAAAAAATDSSSCFFRA